MSASTKDCGPRCRSKQHARQLLTAVTRGSTRQIELFLRRCHNPHTAVDVWGRTVIHMAASRGRWAVIGWLLEHYKPDINVRDVESGWTALHRALFYGQLHAARLLLQHGANLQARDREGLTALDITMKDRLPHVEFSPNGLNEVFTWGENSNLTLGHDKMQARRQPEVVDYFRRRSISIKQLAMSKYHTVFLSSDGKVYTCGHGRGGRLGHGDEQTVLTPRLVEAIQKEESVYVAAARDHTLVQTSSGSLYSFGLNDSHQLGQFPIPTCSLVPKQMNLKVLKGKTVEGVCALRFHSVVYTREAIYTFGLNAGQLGHQKVPGQQYVSQPRQVSALNLKDIQLKLVTSSDAATVVVTTRGDIHALHEYQCRRIATRWQDVVQVGVSGGSLDHQTDMDTLREKGGTELTIVLLCSSGRVFLWRSSQPVMRRCVWSPIRRPLNVLRLALSVHSMAIVTQDGELFSATIPRRSRRTSTTATAKVDVRSVSSPLAPGTPTADPFSVTLAELVEKDDLEDVRVTRVPLVHRATGVAMDRKGTNFAVLQSQANTSLTEVPSVSGSEMSTHFQTLLEEANEFDCIHDVILEVCNVQYAAHCYILAVRSEWFRERLTSHRSPFGRSSDEHNSQQPIVIILNETDPALVRHMLSYIYTDTCELLQVGARVELTQPLSSSQSRASGQDSKTERGEESKRNPVKALQDLAKKYGVKNLAKRLEAVKYLNGRIVTVPGRCLPAPNLRLDRKKYAMLYDVCIQGEDGEEIQCHKCVLVARLEYFNSMLASGWIETSRAEALTLPVPSNILRVILDFLYSDDSPKVVASEDLEFLCNLLVVADQLLITRLKTMTEVSISNLLSLRNVCEVLELASVYNADQLRETCQQFICLNLAALLETRSLEVLSDDVIEQLTQYYRNMIPAMSRRLITPYDEWPSAEYLEQLEQFADEESAAGGSRDTELGSKKARSRRRRSRTKSSGDDLEDRSSKPKERQMSLSSETDLGTELQQVIEEEGDEVADIMKEDAKPEPEIPWMEEPRKKEITVIKRDLSNPWMRARPMLTIPTQAKPTPGKTTPSKPAATRTKPSDNMTNGSSSPTTEDIAASPSNTVMLSPQETPMVSLRDIMAEQDAKEGQPRVGKMPGVNRKLTKTSQKEKKRQQVQTSVTKEAPPPEEDKPQIPVWGGVTKLVTSFKDLLIDQEKESPTKGPATGTPAPTAPGVTPAKSPGAKRVGPMGDAVLTWGLPLNTSRGARPSAAASPPPPTTSPPPLSSDSTGSPTENPWTKRWTSTDSAAPGSGAATCSVTTPTSPPVSFTDILTEELEQKARLVKLTNKPLHLIQTEEQAIQELLIKYQAADNWDEYITVTREHSHVVLAKPTWAAIQ